MDAENGVRPKNYSTGERLECSDVPEKKTQQRPEKQSYLPLQGIRLPNDAVADPVGVRDSNLAHTKSNTAENDTRQRAGTSRKTAVLILSPGS